MRQHELNREFLAMLNSLSASLASAGQVMGALEARIIDLEKRLEAAEARPRFVVHGGGKQ
jgi:hypothetical protein